MRGDTENGYTKTSSYLRKQNLISNILGTFIEHRHNVLNFSSSNILGIPNIKRMYWSWLWVPRYTPPYIWVLWATDNSVFLPRILVGSPSLSTVSGTNYTRDSEERAKSWLNKTVNQGRADGQHNKFITIAMSRIFLNVFLCHEGNLTLDKLLFYFENICCRRHFAGKNLELQNSFCYCYGKQLNLVPTVLGIVWSCISRWKLKDNKN